MTFQERLKDFGIKKFGTLTSFAEALDMKLPSLHQYISGKREPGFNFIRKLKKLGCDLNWLFDTENMLMPVLDTFEYPIYDRIIPLPFIQLKSSEQIHILGFVKIPALKGDCFGLMIMDDSMLPVLSIGDFVVIDINQQLKNGDLVVFQILDSSDDEYFVRRYEEKEGQIILFPSNEMYSKITLTRDKIKYLFKVGAYVKNIKQ